MIRKIRPPDGSADAPAFISLVRLWPAPRLASAASSGASLKPAGSGPAKNDGPWYDELREFVAHHAHNRKTPPGEKQRLRKMYGK
jgi:hypothetical protein